MYALVRQFDHCVRFCRVRKCDAKNGQSSVMTLCSVFNNVLVGPHGIMFVPHSNCCYYWHRVHHHPVYPCHLDSMFHRQYHFAVITDSHDFATASLPLSPIQFENDKCIYRLSTAVIYTFWLNNVYIPAVCYLSPTNRPFHNPTEIIFRILFFNWFDFKISHSHTGGLAYGS